MGYSEFQASDAERRGSFAGDGESVKKPKSIGKGIKRIISRIADDRLSRRKSVSEVKSGEIVGIT